jgi:hypothetical protein
MAKSRYQHDLLSRRGLASAIQDPAPSVTALAYSVFVHTWEYYRGVVRDVGVAFQEDSVYLGSITMVACMEISPFQNDFPMAMIE